MNHSNDSFSRSSGFIEIDGTPCPYLIEGEGIPCVVAGLPSLYPPLFSAGLKKSVQFIFVELRRTFVALDRTDFSGVTMDTLTGEIDQIRHALGFKTISVLGHSRLGFLPLEYALKYPKNASHAIVMGAPPFFNDKHTTAIEAFWQEDASDERKRVSEANHRKLSADVLSRMTPLDAFLMQYVADGPKFWHDPTYDCYWLWLGKTFNTSMLMHYSDVILKDYDPTNRFQEIQTPVFLALGRYDYWVPYRLWDEARLKLPNVSYNLFEKSGHFPMMEERALFDQKLVTWLEES
jgi:proline iminopeptidase